MDEFARRHRREALPAHNYQNFAFLVNHSAYGPALLRLALGIRDGLVVESQPILNSKPTTQF